MRVTINILFGFLVIALPSIEAKAAETILPIKARIIRCITLEEREQMCRQENLCCSLLETSKAETASKSYPLQRANFKIANERHAQMQALRLDGLLTMNVE